MDDKSLLRETDMCVVRVDYACANCGGRMIATDFQPYIDGVQHVCENNDSVAVLDTSYPHIEHREQNGPST